MRGFEVITLTLVPTQRFEDFAGNLQREIQEVTRNRFGGVEPHQFAQIRVIGEDEEPRSLGFEEADVL